jgi:rSAM/selenodomain-associated transferase 1
MTSNARRADAPRVAVFAKAPVPGAVKTRLAALLGAEGAATFHASLVRQALTVATESRAGPVELWCAPDASHPFFAACARDFGVALRRQEGADLGARMRHAAEDALAAGSAVVLIGSDCPALAAASLRDAALALRGHDAVLQPAEDGGYVLIGLSRALPGIFESIAWGGATVMADTRRRLAQAGARWKELAMSWDVDRPEDYARAQAEGLLRHAAS